METVGQASEAVRQVEHWYEHYLVTFVEVEREDPSPLSATFLAIAHERAWRHAVVHAQRTSARDDWAAMTVVHEAAAYEHLLGWTAVRYDIAEDRIRELQSTRGYRHHPR